MTDQLVILIRADSTIADIATQALFYLDKARIRLYKKQNIELQAEDLTLALIPMVEPDWTDNDGVQEEISRAMEYLPKLIAAVASDEIVYRDLVAVQAYLEHMLVLLHS